jgi:DNA polymerase-3 subunit delta
MADELKPAYLLAGTDRPKIDRALQRLRDRFPADATETVDAKEATGDDAVAACNALGLFATSGRLVVVENAEAWKADSVAALGAYLKAPAPDTTIALVAGELKKDAPLAKAVGKAGEVLLWDVPKKGVPGWVGEQFKLHGVRADQAVCRALVEAAGDDLYELATEVDKLATWAGEEGSISVEDVEALVAPRAEAPAFAVTDAFGARDVAGVLRAVERSLERTGDPHSRTIPRLVGTITNHAARLRACQALDAEGVVPADAAGRLRQHPFYVKKLYAQARNFTEDELCDVTIRLAELDHALKGGSRLSSELELERALIEITRPRERAGRAPA